MSAWNSSCLWNSSYQQVLRLDVAVDDVQAVQVFDGTGQVVQHSTGVSLGVFVSGSDGIKEVSALRRKNRTGTLTGGPTGPPAEAPETLEAKGRMCAGPLGS